VVVGFVAKVVVDVVVDVILVVVVGGGVPVECISYHKSAFIEIMLNVLSFFLDYIMAYLE
jgi:hypothetical protein